jgi:hypothetical protein
VTFPAVVAGTETVPAAQTASATPAESAFAGIDVLAMSAVSDVVLETVTAVVSLFWRATNELSRDVQLLSTKLAHPTLWLVG